jgi:hypothetical protein
MPRGPGNGAAYGMHTLVGGTAFLDTQNCTGASQTGLRQPAVMSILAARRRDHRRWSDAAHSTATSLHRPPDGDACYFDVRLMVGFGIAAFVLRLARFPLAPLLLGFILGGLLEDNLRRTLLLHDGSIAFLWERPQSLAIALLMLVTLDRRRVARTAERRERGRQGLVGRGAQDKGSGES